MALKQKLQRLAALIAAGQSRSPAVGRGEEGGQAAEASARSRGHGKTPKSHRQETTAKNKNGEQAARNSEGLARRARKKRRKNKKNEGGGDRTKNPRQSKTPAFQRGWPEKRRRPRIPKITQKRHKQKNVQEA